MNGIIHTKTIKPKVIRFILSKNFIFFLVLFCFSQNTLAQNTDKILQTVNVGIYHNPPLEDYADGQAIGLYPTLLEKIAQKNNWQLNYIYTTWEEAYSNLLEGKIDLLPNIVYLPERDSLVDFNTQTILNIWSELYYNTNVDIENLYELKSKKIGVLKGGAHGIKFKKMMDKFNININYIEFNDYESIALAIEKKEIAGGIFNNIVGLKLSRIYKFNKSKMILEPNRLLFATKKGEKLDLLNAIDTQIAIWGKNKDSFYFKSINTWITQQAQNEFDYKYLKWFIIIVLSIVLLSILWVWSLRRSLNKALLKYKKSTLKLASQKEEKYKIEAILNHTEDDIWSLDRHFKLIAFNQSFKKTYLN